MSDIKKTISKVVEQNEKVKKGKKSNSVFLAQSSVYIKTIFIKPFTI